MLTAKKIETDGECGFTEWYGKPSGFVPMVDTQRARLQTFILLTSHTAALM